MSKSKRSIRIRAGRGPHDGRPAGPETERDPHGEAGPVALAAKTNAAETLEQAGERQTFETVLDMFARILDEECDAPELRTNAVCPSRPAAADYADAVDAAAIERKPSPPPRTAAGPEPRRTTSRQPAPGDRQPPDPEPVAATVPAPPRPADAEPAQVSRIPDPEISAAPMPGPDHHHRHIAKPIAQRVESPNVPGPGAGGIERTPAAKCRADVEPRPVGQARALVVQPPGRRGAAGSGDGPPRALSLQVVRQPGEVSLQRWLQKGQTRVHPGFARRNRGLLFLIGSAGGVLLAGVLGYWLFADDTRTPPGMMSASMGGRGLSLARGAKPRIEVRNSYGTVGAPIALAITVHGVAAGRETYVALSGLPRGARLSGGVAMGTGRWLLRSSEVAGLTVSLAASPPSGVQIRAELLDRDARTPIAPPAVLTLVIEAGRTADVTSARATPDRVRQVRATGQANEQVLLRRAGALMHTGDLLGARRILDQAVAAGSPNPAFALARTYDPKFVATLSDVNGDADFATARYWYEEWYRRSVARGLLRPGLNLDRLLAAFRAQN